MNFIYLWGKRLNTFPSTTSQFQSIQIANILNVELKVAFNCNILVYVSYSGLNDNNFMLSHTLNKNKNQKSNWKAVMRWLETLHFSMISMRSTVFDSFQKMVPSKKR